jgi:hypothetical protein
MTTPNVPTDVAAMPELSATAVESSTLEPDLRSVLTAMSGSPKSIADTARTLLRALTQADNGGPVLVLEDLTSLFLENCTRLVLNSMGRAQSDELGQLFTVLSDVIAAESADASPRELPPAQRLLVQLDTLSSTIATYLKSNNQAKAVALLAPKRREMWRKALEWISEQEHPITVVDVLGSDGNAFFQQKSTAWNALDQMARMGLLIKKFRNENSVAFEASWAGKQACYELNRTEKMVAASRPEGDRLAAEVATAPERKVPGQPANLVPRAAKPLPTSHSETSVASTPPDSAGLSADDERMLRELAARIRESIAFEIQLLPAEAQILRNEKTLFESGALLQRRPREARQADWMLDFGRLSSRLGPIAAFLINEHSRATKKRKAEDEKRDKERRDACGTMERVLALN